MYKLPLHSIILTYANVVHAIWLPPILIQLILTMLPTCSGDQDERRLYLVPFVINKDMDETDANSSGESQ